MQVLRALRRARKHRVESLPPSSFLLAAAEKGALPGICHAVTGADASCYADLPLLAIPATKV